MKMCGDVGIESRTDRRRSAQTTAEGLFILNAGNPVTAASLTFILHMYSTEYIQYTPSHTESFTVHPIDQFSARPLALFLAPHLASPLPLL